MSQKLLAWLEKEKGVFVKGDWMSACKEQILQSVVYKVR